MEYLKEEKLITPKILFTGLDNAGKSSIILTLQREYSKIANLQPTKGVKRRTFTLLGRAISEWDLGGQSYYRISYLKNPGNFFTKTELAIYVIDIKNTERISESLSYLKDVVAQFKKLEIEPPINIFFHKCDPVLVKTSQDELVNMVNDLTKQIRDQVEYDKLYFFKTSIYDQYTLVKSMSDILLELFPRSELIQKTIEDFSIKLNSEAMMVIDDNSLIVGSYFNDENAENILNQTVGYFLTLNDSFLKIDQAQEEDQIMVDKLGKHFLFKQINLTEGAFPYYVLLLKDRNPFDMFFIKKELEAFINVLQEIIGKY
jgi:GTPase SAR1 family protein